MVCMCTGSSQSASPSPSDSPAARPSPAASPEVSSSAAASPEAAEAPSPDTSPNSSPSPPPKSPSQAAASDSPAPPPPSSPCAQQAPAPVVVTQGNQTVTLQSSGPGQQQPIVVIFPQQGAPAPVQASPSQTVQLSRSGVGATPLPLQVNTGNPHRGFSCRAVSAQEVSHSMVCPSASGGCCSTGLLHISTR